jgi:hypothetical protein
MFSCIWPTDLAKTWLDIVAWVTGVGVFVWGVINGLRQAKRANEIRRSELLRSLLDRYYSDVITEGLNTIDEGKFVYSKPSAPFSFGTLQGKGSTLVDPVLLFFSNLCFLKDSGLMSMKEFSFFEWRLRKTMSNQCVSDYVESLADDHKGVSMKVLLTYRPQSTSEEGKCCL